MESVLLYKYICVSSKSANGSIRLRSVDNFDDRCRIYEVCIFQRCNSVGAADLFQ